MVEFKKVLDSPDLKMVLIFLLRKSFEYNVQRVTVELPHEMLRHAMVSDMPGGLVCSQHLPQENGQPS